MALSTNQWYWVTDGPIVAHVQTAVFPGDYKLERDGRRILTFTVRGEGAQSHRIKFWLKKLILDMHRPIYGFEGILEEIDGMVQPLPRRILGVEVDAYVPASPQKPGAALRINGYIGADFEELFCLKAPYRC